jgi:hypothetical protein
MEKELNAQKIKHQAQVAKLFLKDGGHEITHSSCLELISLLYGFDSWNALAAKLREGEK